MVDCKGCDRIPHEAGAKGMRWRRCASESMEGGLSPARELKKVP